jgi:tRNA-dihydrouridine synthase
MLDIVAKHVARMHDFYGVQAGVPIARKHVKAYLQRLGVEAHQIRAFNAEASPHGQLDWIAAFASDDLQRQAA